MVAREQDIQGACESSCTASLMDQLAHTIVVAVDAKGRGVKGLYQQNCRT